MTELDIEINDYVKQKEPTPLLKIGSFRTYLLNSSIYRSWALTVERLFDSVLFIA